MGQPSRGGLHPATPAAQIGLLYPSGEEALGHGQIPSSPGRTELGIHLRDTLMQRDTRQPSVVAGGPAVSVSSGPLSQQIDMILRKRVKYRFGGILPFLLSYLSVLLPKRETLLFF